MSKNKALKVKGVPQDESLTSLALSEDLNRQMVPLDEVYGNLDEFIKNIDIYRSNLSDCEPYSVDGKWYRLGGASVKDINKALDSIVDYAKNSFSLVSDTELEQSKSIQNVCVLISLLALAEGKLYAQLQGLSSDSDATLDTLAEYEAALNGIANNNEDTEQNIKMIAQTMGKILEEKNKQVLSFKADLIKSRDNMLNQMAELKVSFENYCSTIEGKFKTGESDLRGRIEESIAETKETQQQTLEKVREKMESLIANASDQVARAKRDIEAVVSETKIATKDLLSELLKKVDDSLDTARGEQQQALSEVRKETESFLSKVTSDVNLLKNEVARVIEDTKSSTHELQKNLSVSVENAIKEAKKEQSQALGEVRKNSEEFLSKASTDVNLLKNEVAKVITETKTSTDELQKILSNGVESAIKEAKDKQQQALDEVSKATNNLLAKSETEIGTMKNDVESVINETKAATKALLADSSEKIETSLSGLSRHQDEAFGKMSASMDSEFKKQDALIAERTRRNFFDSTFYKVVIGAVSIAALVLSIVLFLKA